MLFVVVLLASLLVSGVKAKSHILFGAVGLSDFENLDAYEAALGLEVASYVEFQPVVRELEAQQVRYIELLCNRLGKDRKLVMTIEPFGGLEQVDPAKLGSQLGSLGAGCELVIRFAHEMNGDWYVWGAKPDLFKRVYTELARQVKKVSRGRVAMMWSPNVPYSRTSHPRQYYPNSTTDLVDWIGLSLYNRNCMQDKAILGLKNYEFDEWLVQTGKPVMIAEGAVTWYVDGGPNCVGSKTPPTIESELGVKQEFWTDVWSDNYSKQFPFVKVWNWFEHKKPVGDPRKGIVDYRVVKRDKKSVTKAFVKYLRQQAPNKKLGAAGENMFQTESVPAGTIINIITKVIRGLEVVFGIVREIARSRREHHEMHARNVTVNATFIK